MLRGSGGSAGAHQQSLPFNTEEQGVFDGLALIFVELGQDPLQALHGGIALLIVAELQQHIALGLFDGKHWADGLAALCHGGLQGPVSADGQAHHPTCHVLALQQRPVGCCMGCCDASKAGGGGEGVVESTDQISDAAAGGVDQDHQRSQLGGIQPQPLLPLFVGPVEVGQLIGVNSKGLQHRPRQIQQRDAQGRGLLQLMGFSVAVGADHASPDAAEPVLRLQGRLQQRQQPGEIAGEMTGNEHQSQISAALAKHGADLLDGRIKEV